MGSTRRAAMIGALGAVLLAAGGGGAWFATSRRALSLDPRQPETDLDDVEREVAATIRVPEVTAADLAARLGRGEVVLYDVRSEAEYAAGHIPGAIHVEPGKPADVFTARHGERHMGRHAVFYCSVGVRSGLLIERLADTLRAHQPASVANLRGGLFRWHAEGRPVIDLAGSSVARIHPFDADWEALLLRTLGHGT